MTQFHAYDELTWPQVSSLPRNHPIVLPLGTDYPLELLAEALGYPHAIYLLPPFPFGWQGSSLSVNQDVLEVYLLNIISGLRDDGFSNTLLIVPPGIHL